MPLILPGNVGSATAATGYDVANSCRFNDGDSAYMHKTPGGAGTSADLFTFSMWIKRGIISSSDRIVLFYAQSDAQNFDRISFTDADVLEWKGVRSDSQAFNLTTSQVFRDISSWYHLHFIWDSADSTADNRMRIYVNGTQVTAFGTRANPSSGLDAIIGSAQKHSVGSTGSSGTYYDGYMAEVVYLDGQELTPDGNTGEFDEDSGIWKPIDVSGLTFGTNGFYLEFKESGTGTNASGMGADTSGNTNHFAVNNLTAIDQSTDTCTNNFATLNPLDNVVSQAVFTEGNLKSTMNNSNSQGVGSTGTFWVSSGKWYVEAKLINNAGDNGSAFGVTGKVGLSTASADRVGNSADAITYTDTGQKAIAGSYTNSYGSSFTNGDIIGIYIDLDNLKIYFAKNGSLQNSGTGLTLNAIANTLNGVYTFSVGMNAGTGAPVFEINFGGTQTYSISSAVTDDNGYGNFEYSPNITGDSVAKKFYSMCTKNLAEYG